MLCYQAIIKGENMKQIIYIGLGAAMIWMVSACVGMAVGATVGAATSVAGSGVKLIGKTAVAGVKLGARGAGAVLTSNPKVPKSALKLKASEAIGPDLRTLEISEIYEEEDFTFYTITTGTDEVYYCVVASEGKGKSLYVSEARCEPATGSQTY